MSVRVDVELDIFSGNPNPTWTLADPDGRLFLKRLAELPITSARKLSGNLGYRGFSLEVTNETEKMHVRIQNGIVHVSSSNNEIYHSDRARTLERWLLDSGKPFLDSTLLRIVENELATNSH